MSLPLSSPLKASPSTNASPPTFAPLPDKEQRFAWVLLGILSAACVLAYLDSLRMVSGSWNNPQYSHGFLIPIVAGVLLWMKRQPLTRVSPLERWCGVGFVVAAVGVRVVSAYYTTFTTDNVSLVPCLLGVFLLVGGWRALSWSALPILFLLFMYPWPDRLEQMILVNLKARVAMPVSLFALQTVGVEAYLNGNMIELGDGTKMNVVDACAGLGMLNIFLMLSAAFALIVTWRPTWERSVLFLSAVPIALAANAMRITLEGLIYYYGESILSAVWVRWVAVLFHNHLAAWLMMLIALGMLYAEYHLLQRLVIEEDEHQALRQHLSRVQSPREG